MRHHFEKKIEEKRRDMLKAAKKYGIDSEETLRESSELDQLILEYQKKFG